MIDTETVPKPGERWLSCPPYLLIAHVVAVDTRARTPLVTYQLHDEEGSVLETIEHAVLDRGWWQTFQPLVRRYG